MDRYILRSRAYQLASGAQLDVSAIANFVRGAQGQGEADDIDIGDMDDTEYLGQFYYEPGAGKCYHKDAADLPRSSRTRNPCALTSS